MSQLEQLTGCLWVLLAGEYYLRIRQKVEANRCSVVLFTSWMNFNRILESIRYFFILFISSTNAQEGWDLHPSTGTFLTLVIILATVSIELLPPFRATDTKVCGLQQGFRGVLGPKREVEVPLPLCLYCADTFFAVKTWSPNLYGKC